MKHYISLIILFAALALAGGCRDDLLYEDEPDSPEFEEGELVKVPLSLKVSNFSVKGGSGTRVSEPSDRPEPETDEERAIHDIWVFQFNPSTGQQLVNPRYYTITDQAQLDDLSTVVSLTEAQSTIYVVANTGDNTWATTNNINTLDKLKKQTLPFPQPLQAGVDRISIPMGGVKENIAVAANRSITVPVTRMYAKVKVKLNINVEGMKIYSINVGNIPWHCQVTSMVKSVDGKGEPLAVEMPDNHVSRAVSKENFVTDADGTWAVIYVPENICGENGNTDRDGDKVLGGITGRPLVVNVQTKYNGMNYYYEVYPGGNDYSNFNIQRNCVYRVTIDINTDTDQHNPSSNSFIVEPGDLLAFEPYNRVETGGVCNYGTYKGQNYNIKQFLDPDVPDKKIDRVEIIWQTPDCIGNNEKDQLVWLGPETDPKIYQKIYVKTKTEGNALVAARNASGKIIWSWHIWVTGNQPDNLAKAMVYYTYDWDNNGPKPNQPRVPGYSVMSCNLGALADRGAGTGFNNAIPTFGLLYQWGRKDPFPPAVNNTRESQSGAYNSYSGTQYRNDNSAKATKTDTDNESYLFHSKTSGSSKISQAGGGILFSVANPTVYIAGTTERYGGITSSYTNGGDWLPSGQSNNTLWGGTDPGTGSKKWSHIEDTFWGTASVNLCDNYSPEKSIFDPCPTGWRVPPGDLWLGFTSTGRNPVNDGWVTGNMSEINYNKTESDNRFGMSMFMQAFRSGPTSFFPTQGTRRYDGQVFSVGYCGNYHNATCDVNNRVNIMHIHNSASLFHIFEVKYEWFYVKSTACPVRCVRDRK